MKKLYVVGAGTGNYDDFTIRAVKVLNSSDVIYCDELMFGKIKNYFDNEKIIKNEYTKTKTRCLNAIGSANSGITTSIVGSGDTGIYGISNIIYEEVEKQQSNIDIEVIPGMTSAISGASLLGSPLTRDFAVISLSDSLADKQLLANKLEALAQTDIIIVFYSPSNPTKENLIMARDILLKYRSAETVVGITSHIGDEGCNDVVSTIEMLPLQDIDAFSTIFIGNDQTYTTKTKKIVTPLIRGTK